ncbi:hypothetical protein C8R45DRAFT_1107031 [Mycena sanguinolenta]|nr:hypothetical protein C8R45DRAFT_1107031 [Mycena sanguinolenta]
MSLLQIKALGATRDAQNTIVWILKEDFDSDDAAQAVLASPSAKSALAAIFLVSIPQLLVVFLTLLAFTFAPAALYHFFHRRLTFACHVPSKSASPSGNAQAPSAFTSSRCPRLIGVTLRQMIVSAVVAGKNMAFIIRSRLRLYTSWATVPSNFSRVALFPTLFIPVVTWHWTYRPRWAVPLAGVLFAFGRDAVTEYRAAGWRWGG